MNRKLLPIILIFLITFTSTGCTAKKDIDEIPKAVEIMTVKKELRPTYLKYIGTVVSDTIIKYSFKSSGRLDTIHIEKGDSVKKGDVLATIDTSDLANILSASESKVIGLKATVDNLKDTYEDMKVLYESNSISESSFNQVKLQYDTAMSQYQAAINEKNIHIDLLQDGNMIAKEDGIVVDILYEVPELVPQGYPVVITRSNAKVINIGITQKDIPKIYKGMKSEISADGIIAQGEVKNIAEIPDAETRMYDVEISLDNDLFPMGAICNVKLIEENSEGLWIPMNTILSDGEEFVYIIENNFAYKNTIEIEAIDNGMCLVDGLKEDAQVVTSGMQYLAEGKKVNVTGGSNK